MNKSRKIKKKKLIELKMTKKIVNNGKPIFTILYHSYKKHFFLQFCTEIDSIQVFDPNSEDFYTPIDFDIEAIYMKLTQNQDQLVFIGVDASLYVVDLQNLEIIKKFRLRNKDMEIFVFADPLCENVFTNSSTKGLFRLNLKTGRLKQLKLRALRQVGPDTFLCSSDHMTLYGIIKENFYYCYPASYNVKKGFKLKVLPARLKFCWNMPNALNKEETLLFTGDYESKLAVIDLRSEKTQSNMQFESQSCIVCLKRRKRLIFGGTPKGEVIIIKDCYPFKVIFYCQVSQSINSLCLSPEFLVIAGNYQDYTKFFDMQEIEANLANLLL